MLCAGDKQFFIVTPCLNAVDTIDRTIDSVVRQEGNFYIHYHVQDGGSVDGTIEKLKQWQGVLQNGYRRECGRIMFSWESSPDKGLYDAIIKGFDRMYAGPDDFMGWINADDMLLPKAVNVVCRISERYPDIQWIGGYQYVLEKGEPIIKRLIPTPTLLIRQGLCDGYHWHHLQQEGIFFKKRLWFKAKHALHGFRFAGDWNLWREFARSSELFQYEEPLGAFCRRRGQLSVVHHKDYVLEIEKTLPLKNRTLDFMRITDLPKESFFNRIIRKNKMNSKRLEIVNDRMGTQVEYAKRCKILSNQQNAINE